MKRTEGYAKAVLCRCVRSALTSIIALCGIKTVFQLSFVYASLFVLFSMLASILLSCIVPLPEAITDGEILIADKEEDKPAMLGMWFYKEATQEYIEELKKKGKVTLKILKSEGHVDDGL